MMLSCGTGAWRVRDAINTVSRALGITCSTDVALTSISMTCFDEGESCSEVLSLPTTGVNTTKLSTMQAFVKEFPDNCGHHTTDEMHALLDEIDQKPGNYKPWNLGLASGLACAAFTFLLGGGPVEMLCAFLGAGFGNFFRALMLRKHLSLLLNVSASVAAACTVYVGAIKLMELLFGVSAAHEAGYICAMLFIIPGFPLITGGIDLAKLDLRSGLERIAYALLIITTATLTGWVVALILQFHPADFVELGLSPALELVFRLITSFCGVYGFSLMFNSPRTTAAFAGCIGAVANTLRLELIDLTGMPIGVAAFLGALLAGLLASLLNRHTGIPRIAITVPSIVIMVPGLFMYRGIYHIGLNQIGDGALWLTKAVLIVLALPLGLIFARFLTDPKFRHCN